MKLILGLGNTGLSIARFLARQQIAFKLADSRDNPPLLAQYQDEFSHANLTLGDWSKNLLTNVDEVFISPGIAQNESIVIWARKKNIPVVSDIELFDRYAKTPIIGITGSNGKSTVTQLLGEMIANNGKKVAVGGNIGTPALDCLDDDIDFYVLELSSYQLDYTQHLSLLTGVVLNITPDHLDRYDDFESYKQSKLSLYDYCQKPIFNLDEPHTPNGDGFSLSLPKKSTDFGTVTCHDSCFLLNGDDTLMDVNDMQLIGEHNVTNVLCALALGGQIGLSTGSMIDTIKNFKGLEHRLEWVTQKQGIDYYNDSKATNVTAAITAITAIKQKHPNISLIMGGIKKPEDYAPLFELINKSVENVVLIGQSAKQLGKGIEQSARAINTTGTQITYASSMREALNLASMAINNGAVLLSPACASFDMFDDFEQRGQKFKECANDR